MIFPFDFGFVPSTKAPDGDPLDVLVLIEEATFPGCLLECALIGVLEAEQSETEGKVVRNDRLIAVARQSLTYSKLKHIDELDSTTLHNIEAFFVNYQKLRGVQVKILGRHGPERAAGVLKKARRSKS